MPDKEIGKLTVTIAPEALHEIIAGGRLLELAAKVASQAAAQISAQIVDHVANAALNKTDVGAATVSVSYVFDGGDFGTVPRHPHFGVGPIGPVQNALQRLATHPETRGGD
jgi:hypothetical protein